MYYLRQRMRVSGPFAVQQIKALLHRGRVSRSDKVSTDRTTWVSIGECPDIIEPRKEAVAATLEPVEAAPEADRRMWFYTRGGSQQPDSIDTAALSQLVASGQVGPTEMVWTEGFQEWKPVSGVPELAGAAGPGQAFPQPDGLPPVQTGQGFELPPVVTKRKGWF